MRTTLCYTLSRRFSPPREASGMRERDNSTPRSERPSIPPVSSGGAVGDDAAGAGVAQRSVHRTKRPPPLPNRKAHKIKRIKSQRSSPWAALDADRARERSGQGAGRSVAATTVVRHEGELIEAEREREAKRRQRQMSAASAPAHFAQPLGVAQVSAPVQPTRAWSALPARNLEGAENDPTDRRWLLLLKVGRDELAGIWDGRLESCEPSIWRPATKSWAPLFEIPQIATIVTATVKERQARSRLSSVPPSPAPRRRQPSGVSAAAQLRRRSTPPPGTVPPPAAVPRLVSADEPRASDSHRPSSLAELRGHHAVPPAALLAVRSPYIPPPPRLPTLAPAAVRVHPAFADDSDDETLPAYALAKTEESAARAIPLTERRATPQPAQRLYAVAPTSVWSDVPREAPSESGVSTRSGDSVHGARAVDSYAPQARTLAPPANARPSGFLERAGWLSAGVAAALLITTFTGISSSMREGLAGWLDPEPGGMLASALSVPTATSHNGKSDSDAAPANSAAAAGAKEKADSSDKSEESNPRVLSVEELPMLNKNGELVPSKAEKSSSREDETRASVREESHAAPRAAAASEPASHASKARATHAAPAPRKSAKPAVNKVGFDAGAARRALASAVGRAQFCAAEQATGTVVVTFAPSGGVTSASLANMSGEDVRKGCVIRAFRGARITPFQGDAVTVQKSFRLR